MYKVKFVKAGIEKAIFAKDLFLQSRNRYYSDEKGKRSHRNDYETYFTFNSEVFRANYKYEHYTGIYRFIGKPNAKILDICEIAIVNLNVVL